MITIQATPLHLLTYLLLSCCFLLTSHAQTTVTRVEGVVIEAESGDPLGFANVAFTGTSIGTNTDNDGRFELEAEGEYDSLTVSFLGYQTQTIAIKPGESQEVRVALRSEALSLDEITVTAEKGKYKRKGNPAVDLIKKVIDRKDQNRLESQGYYEYDKYEKIQLDVSNLSESFVDARIFRDIRFVFDYMDTTDTGTPYLPFFLQESKSRVYYSKESDTEKEYRKALKLTNLDDFTTNESVYNLTRRLYQDIDIYDNKILLFDRQFVSPVAGIAPTFYRYYIVDTLQFQNQEAIRLAFIPNNKYNLGFEGNLFITNDSSYQVIGVKLSVLEQANLNFVKNLLVEQEFEKVNGVWVVSKEEIQAEYEITEKIIGIIGRKTTIYSNYSFEPSGDPAIFDQPGNIISAPDEDQKPPSYWEDARPEPLTRQEKDIYQMIDTLKTVPFFKTAIKVVRLISTGYITSGAVDIGSVFSFLSYNEVEGWRTKFGGKTNHRFSEDIQLKGYLAYGFRDQRLKYSASFRYLLDPEFSNFPDQYLSFKIERDNRFPGQFTRFVEEDNLFLSFRTGIADKMIAYDLYELEYSKAFPNNFRIDAFFNTQKREAAGDFDFNFIDPEGDAQRFLDDIRTTEAGVHLQYAPNAEYFEGAHLKYPLPNRYPIFDLTYTNGLEDLVGGEYQFHNLQLGITKRFYLSALGYSDVSLEGGKIWGEELPYILLHVPQANQTYAFQSEAFNVMNFMEFVADEHLTFHITHQFNGYLLNKIPLIRKLKWRSIFSFKTIYGNVTDANDPEQDRSLVQFPTTVDGQLETFSLREEPYMEFSVGIANIFKVLRFDYVRRLNYLGNPNLPSFFGIDGAGLRIGAELRF